MRTEPTGLDDASIRALSSKVTRAEFLRLMGVGAVALGGGGFLAACGSKSVATKHPTQSAAPHRGGILRAGISGGSAKDTLDAQNFYTHVDQARALQLYDSLATYDAHYLIQMALAEEITADRPDLWTIRLKPDLTFHNGKSVTADDVIFSLRRILDPKVLTFGGAALAASLDPNGIQKVDNLTVQLHLTRPDVTIRSQLAQYYNAIVPVGYSPQKPIGTGPFKYKSFTPGVQSIFTRNANYWRTGQPLVDEVVIFDFPSDTARVDALLGGQVDVIDQLPFTQVDSVRRAANLRVLVSQSGEWLPFVMNISLPPFNDMRVRQAMRLIVNRKQMVAVALDGYGRVGNDLYAPFDPCYASELPQREQDLGKARSLLRQAGQSALQLTLATGDVAVGILGAAQALAQQAKAAGVTINIQNLPSSVLYGGNYLKWRFTQTYWGTRDYLEQAALTSLPTAPFDETHWDNPQYTQLIVEARGTVDDQKRCELLKEAQKLEYEEGGYIIWGFADLVDAFSNNITGFVPDRATLPLDNYAFRQVGFVG